MASIKYMKRQIEYLRKMEKIIDASDSDDNEISLKREYDLTVTSL